MAQQEKSHQPFPDKAASKPVGRTSGDLIVMAVLVGVSRVLFGRKKSTRLTAMSATNPRISTLLVRSNLLSCLSMKKPLLAVNRNQKF
jgi:hypothetical protein